MFTNPVAGFIPNSEFVYSTTTVNADDVNCTNLTATNANITNLVTTTFSPVNINGTNLSVATATINDLTANTITSPDGYITTIINNTSFITLANILTATIDDAIIKNIDCSDIFIKDKTNLLSKTRIYRDGNSTYFIGRGIVGEDSSSFVFITGTTNPALVVQSNNITYIQSLQTPNIETDNILIDNTITTNNLQSNTITNTGLITSGLITSGSITGDISSNLIAGNGINLTTAGGLTTITNSAPLPDPLTINTLNCTTINSTSIYNTSSITTNTINNKIIEIVDVNNGNISSITKTNNILNLFGTSTSTPIDINFFTKVYTSNGPILQLLGTENKVVINQLLGANTIECTAINNSGMTLSAISSSDITNSLHEMYIWDKGGTTGKTQIQRLVGYFEMFNPIAGNDVPYKFYTGQNTGIPQLEINETGIRCNIAQNLIAGIGIFLNTVNGVTEIINTELITDPLNVNNLNVSVHAQIEDLSVTTNIGCNFLASASIDCSVFNASTSTSNTINSTTITTSNINFTGGIVGPAESYLICDSIACGDLVSQDLEINGPSRLNGATTIDSINSPLATITNINTTNLTANTVTGNISSNLASGTGINLNTVGGITTIEATGGISTSTEYGFQVHGNQGDIAVTAGQLVPNNQIQYCFPSSAAYNTGNYTYYVQSPGYYQVGFKIFQLNNAGAGPCRFAIFKNGINELQGGQDVGTTETLSGVLYCNQGDYLDLRITTGLVVIYQGYGHTWFYGYKLQPTNNTVGITTDLTVGTLTALTNVTAPNIIGDTITGNISSNLSQGNNIVITTALGVSEIGTVPDLSSNSITSTTGTFTNITGDISSNLSQANNIVLNTSLGVTEISTVPDLSSNSITATTGTFTNITGDISSNLSQANNIVLNTTLGVTEISTSPDLTSNSITSTTGTFTNLNNVLLGVGSFFTRRQNGVYSPGTSSQQYFSNFDTAVVSNPHVSWVTPNIGSGGANTGFIINTSGTYKIDWTFVAHSVAYNNRIGWFTRLLKNGVTWDADRYVGFIYTRGDQTSYAQWGSSSSHCIVDLVAGDYIHLVTNVAKATPLHNNLWDQIEAGWGAVCSFQLLGIA